ncbi:MAG: PEGA domain-containing protein [Acidobacteriia bacterium]|nr:PEGA domain-containing protein [Terriglobia bacterium]
MSDGYPQAIEELKRLAEALETAVTLEQLRPIFYRADEISKEHSNEELQAIVAGIHRRITERGALLRQGVQPPPLEAIPPPQPLPPLLGDDDPPPSVTVPMSARPLPRKTGQVGAAPGMFAAVTESPKPPPPPPPFWQRPYILAGAGFVIVLLAAACLYFYLYVYLRPASSQLIAVQLQTIPPGASIRVDHILRGVTDSKLELPPGTYTLELVLNGYQPVVSSLTVKPDAPRLFSMTLQPLPQTVRIFTDLRSGSVLLDDQPAAELREGQLILDGVSPGAHRIKIAGQGSEAAFSFHLEPGKAPQLTTPVTARNVLAVVVNNSSSSATAHANVVPMKLALDGKHMGDISSNGLPLESVNPGDHELVFGEGDKARAVFVNFGASPVLTAFLKLDLNKGSLLVTANEDGAIVYVNGREYKRPIANRELRIPLLDVGSYQLEVSKDGYEKPQPQSVAIRKGGEARVEFNLRPIPRVAALRVDGATPGATILLDQHNLGTIQPDGTFSASGIAPGEHRIDLRKDKRRPKTLRVQFTAGETVHLSGKDKDLVLASVAGAIRLQISPPESTVTIRGADDKQSRPVTETTLTLPEGSYQFMATAPGYLPSGANVEVLAGESIDVDLRLSKEKLTTVVRIGMEGWEQPSAWVKDGQWLARKGGRFVLFRKLPAPGVFVLTAAILKGKTLQWVVNYSDDNNYDLFELDKDRFTRKRVRGGKTSELSKTKHGIKDPDFFILTVDISQHVLVHKLYRNGNWSGLDSASFPDTDLVNGRFGLLIADNTQIGLSNFSFTTK